MTETRKPLEHHQALFREGANLDVSIFVCECGYEDCTSTVALSLEEYKRIRSNPTWLSSNPVTRFRRSPESSATTAASSSSRGSLSPRVTLRPAPRPFGHRDRSIRGGRSRKTARPDAVAPEDQAPARKEERRVPPHQRLPSPARARVQRPPWVAAAEKIEGIAADLESQMANDVDATGARLHVRAMQSLRARGIVSPTEEVYLAEFGVVGYGDVA